MEKLRRKNVFLVILVVDLFALLALAFIYLESNPGLLLAFECNQVIRLGTCPEDIAVEGTAVTGGIETAPPREVIFLAVDPEPIDTYLTNPGMGWQHDTNTSSRYLPETVAYSDRQRISWDILNPLEGIYDWSALDGQLSAAASAGKLFSFRVYTMAGEMYGSHKIPVWVLDEGARILPSGEPDYSNCVYQEEWGNFVKELIDRYDGNADIAFIDISGYGNFNEWSWRDDQTEWDDLWEQNYASGTANASTMSAVDSQARRRMADMFIGGSFEGHRCRDDKGAIQVVDYSYPGFTSTQLVMPFAGITQSTQYVFSRRSDVGFRYDSLGRVNNSEIGKISKEISQIWKAAPVVFELSKPAEFDREAAAQLLRATHASLVHNNEYRQGREDLQELIARVGYRYYLRRAEFEVQPYPGGTIDLVMFWQNTGMAPSYPRMGQGFQLHLYVVDQTNRTLVDYPIQADISSWSPAVSENSPPEYSVRQTLLLPEAIPSGLYRLKVAMIEGTSGKPVDLAFSGDDGSGAFWLADLNITGAEN